MMHAFGYLVEELMLRRVEPVDFVKEGRVMLDWIHKLQAGEQIMQPTAATSSGPGDELPIYACIRLKCKQSSRSQCFPILKKIRRE